MPVRLSEAQIRDLESIHAIGIVIFERIISEIENQKIKDIRVSRLSKYLNEIVGDERAVSALMKLVLSVAESARGEGDELIRQRLEDIFSTFYNGKDDRQNVSEFVIGNYPLEAS